MNCKECGIVILTITEFINHCKLEHAQNTILQCPVLDCPRIYTSKKSIRSHFKIHNTHNTLTSVPYQVNPADELDLIYNATDNESATDNLYETFSNNQTKFALSLLANEKLTRKQALKIAQETQTQYASLILSMEPFVTGAHSMKRLFTLLKQPSMFESEFMFRKNLQSQGILIETKKITIDSKSEHKFVGGKLKVVRDDRKIELFDIKQLLEKFLNIDKVMSELMSHLDDLQHGNSEVISNVIQTAYWYNIAKSNDPNVLYLPINIYFDDFEPLNALGSHSGAYKIGAVYFQIPCLPECALSKLKYIFLAMLVFSYDRSRCGNDRVFQPLIRVINDLQNNGINVKFNQITNVRFVVTQLFGDNLGMNSILGFTESFSATYYCRICNLPKSILQTQSVESSTSIRNEKNYAKQLALNDLSATGIKERCVWNDVKLFHVCNNSSVDIMHDLLEGVCHYNLTNVLNNLIYKHNFFSIDELNLFIQSYNYGPLVKNKKIDSITTDMLNINKIKCTAYEMFVLYMNLSTIIGHKVPRVCEEWSLYILLRKIMYIVFSKSIHNTMYQYLENLISEHHELYIKLFGNLKPKHHFMVHYPRLCKQFGPLSASSNMRFESFHKIFKSVSNAISCRINILTSMTTKFEYQIANLLRSFNSFKDPIEHGPKEKFDVKKMSLKYNHQLCADDFMTSWIKKEGILIKKNVVIQIGLDLDETAEFGIVEHIIVNMENVFLCCRNLETTGFDEHNQCYQISITNNFSITIFEAHFLEKTGYIVDGIKTKFLSFL